MFFRAAKWLITAASLSASQGASAQTWLAGATSPALRDLVSVDRTGEPNWIFGSEDVAGDGVQTFGPAERALDVRSAYADLEGRRLALRAYVSSDAVPPELRLYAFVDVDQNAESGGSAGAPEIDPALDAAAGRTGYELVIGVLQAPDTSNVWRWEDSSDSYEPVEVLDQLELSIEAGTDRDPLDIGEPPNGYLQVSLDPRPLGIPGTCAVELLFRSSNDSGAGDADIGERGPCRPVDADANGVADVAEAVTSCESDEQCPADGSCVAGQCRAPEVVLGPGEAVRGGAFACSSASQRAPVGSAWLGSMAVLSCALLQRMRRRRADEGAER